MDAERGKFDWRIVIPPNTTATVYVPAAERAIVREGGDLADEAPGVSLRRREPDAAVYEVDSGDYQFTADAAPA